MYFPSFIVLCIFFFQFVLIKNKKINLCLHYEIAILISPILHNFNFLSHFLNLFCKETRLCQKSQRFFFYFCVIIVFLLFLFILWKPISFRCFFIGSPCDLSLTDSICVQLLAAAAYFNFICLSTAGMTNTQVWRLLAILANSWIFFFCHLKQEFSVPSSANFYSNRKKRWNFLEFYWQNMFVLKSNLFILFLVCIFEYIILFLFSNLLV